MKNILILFSILGVTIANAQKIKEKEVPLNIKLAFEKKFPGVKVQKWERENVNYTAEFDLKDVETSAIFDENGNCVETETEIKIAELPNAAKDYIAKNEPDKKIKEASRIIDQAGKITFEVDVNQTDFVFDTQGHFLSKELNSEKA